MFLFALWIKIDLGSASAKSQINKIRIIIIVKASTDIIQSLVTYW